MAAFDEDILSLMNKRVYDMAGLLPDVKVTLNNQDLPINSFLKYVDMYFTGEEGVHKIRDS
jgi:DNA topoisomerase-2